MSCYVSKHVDYVTRSHNWKKISLGHYRGNTSIFCLDPVTHLFFGGDYTPLLLWKKLFSIFVNDSGPVYKHQYVWNLTLLICANFQSLNTVHNFCKALPLILIHLQSFPLWDGIMLKLKWGINLDKLCWMLIPSALSGNSLWGRFLVCKLQVVIFRGGNTIYCVLLSRAICDTSFNFII